MDTMEPLSESAPWENKEIPEIEQWELLLQARNQGLIERSELLEIAERFSNETKKAIRAALKKALLDCN